MVCVDFAPQILLCRVQFLYIKVKVSCTEEKAVLREVPHSPVCWLSRSINKQAMFLSWSPLPRRFACRPFFFFLKSLLNLLQHCFCFTFWLFGWEARVIFPPRPRIKSTPWKAKSEPLEHQGGPCKHLDFVPQIHPKGRFSPPHWEWAEQGWWIETQARSALGTCGFVGLLTKPVGQGLFIFILTL